MAELIKYEKLELIKRGGTATVFRGRQLDPTRPVAIKELRAELFQNPRHRERFFREADTWARLDHDHLVVVRDIDRTHGWVILELMDHSLANLLPQQGQSSEAVQRMLGDCLRALDYLHGEGFLHGNIKPTNILFDTRGRTKLSDGHCVSLDDPTGLPIPAESQKYVAPEMFEESFGAIGAGTDLYCLGIVALEMLMGPDFDSLFRGINDAVGDRNMAWSRWHGSANERAPHVRDVAPRASAELAAVIDRLIQKEMRNRYGQASEALEDLQLEFPSRASSQPPPRSVPAPSARQSADSGPSQSPPPRPPARSTSEGESGIRPPPRSAPTPGGSAVVPATALAHWPEQPIVVRILSDPRSGEIVGFSGDELKIGDDDAAELRFDTAAYPHIVGRSALLRRETTGWAIKRLTPGGMLVNQQVVQNVSQVRSGDVVRLSATGPDLQFILQSSGSSFAKLLAKYGVSDGRATGASPARKPPPIQKPPSARPPAVEHTPAPGQIAPPARPRKPSEQPKPPPMASRPQSGGKKQAPAEDAPPPGKLADRLSKATGFSKLDRNTRNWIIVGLGLLVILVIVLLIPFGGEPKPSDTQKRGAPAERSDPGQRVGDPKEKVSDPNPKAGEPKEKTDDPKEKAAESSEKTDDPKVETPMPSS